MASLGRLRTRVVGVAAASVLLVACGSSGGSSAGTSAANTTSTISASDTSGSMSGGQDASSESDTHSASSESDAHSASSESDDAHSASGGERPTAAEFHGPLRARLGRQLVRARRIALAAPTYGDAMAAGWEPTTPYAPGTGAHAGRDENTQSPGQPFDVGKPQALMYLGTKPGSPVVGMMYVQVGGDRAPSGFAGPLDEWHPVHGICLKADETDPLLPTTESVTKRRCERLGGRFLDLTVWIQHVWVVPGWEAPGGVFAHLNADIVCVDRSGASVGDGDGTTCRAPTGGRG